MSDKKPRVDSFGQTDSFAVVGVDPGATTGVFIFQHYLWAGGGYPEFETERVQTWHLAPDEVWPVLYKRLDEITDLGCWGYLYIAVEKYIITSRTAKLSQQPEALEVTGVVKALADYYRAPVTQYMKANLKFAGNDALKRARWYNPSMRHANDAARQAFALLHEVHYPTWARVSAGGMMESDDRGETT